MLIPGIAGMSVVATTFTALAFNLTYLREEGILKRMRGRADPDRLLPRRAARLGGDERLRPGGDRGRGRQAAVRRRLARRTGRC